MFFFLAAACSDGCDVDQVPNLKKKSHGCG